MSPLAGALYHWCLKSKGGIFCDEGNEMLINIIVNVIVLRLEIEYCCVSYVLRAWHIVPKLGRFSLLV